MQTPEIPGSAACSPPPPLLAVLEGAAGSPLLGAPEGAAPEASFSRLGGVAAGLPLAARARPPWPLLPPRLGFFSYRYVNPGSAMHCRTVDARDSTFSFQGPEIRCADAPPSLGPASSSHSAVHPSCTTLRQAGLDPSDTTPIVITIEDRQHSLWRTCHTPALTLESVHRHTPLPATMIKASKLLKSSTMRMNETLARSHLYTRCRTSIRSPCKKLRLTAAFCHSTCFYRVYRVHLQSMVSCSGRSATCHWSCSGAVNPSKP